MGLAYLAGPAISPRHMRTGLAFNNSINPVYRAGACNRSCDAFGSDAVRIVRRIVKIDGTTTLENTRLALGAGADWIGLNSVSGPRRIELPRILPIVKRLDNPARAVAFVALQAGELEERLALQLAGHGVQRLQFYDAVIREVMAHPRGKGFETIFVRSVDDGLALDALDGFLAACSNARPHYVLFDAPAHGPGGGTGCPANWEAVAQARRQGRSKHWPLVILAGGFNAANAAPAGWRCLCHCGVDAGTKRPGQDCGVCQGRSR